jgi:hypothetical protein
MNWKFDKLDKEYQEEDDDGWSNWEDWPEWLHRLYARLAELEQLHAHDKDWVAKMWEELCVPRSLSPALQVLQRFHYVYPLDDHVLLWDGSNSALHAVWQLLRKECGSLRSFVSRFHNAKTGKPVSYKAVHSHRNEKDLPPDVLKALRDEASLDC